MSKSWTGCPPVTPRASWMQVHKVFVVNAGGFDSRRTVPVAESQIDPFFQAY